MQRLLLTLTVSFGLLAALQLYARWVTPYTRAVEQPRLPPSAKNQVPSSSTSSLAAKDWLAEEQWIPSAAIRWQRSDQTFMYAQTVETVSGTIRDLEGEGSGDLVRMKPFAMIWKDPQHPENAPLTIVAESARIRFENHFFDDQPAKEESISLSGEDPGRIVGAALEGRTRITGPQGLTFEGQDFIFADEAGSAVLYSDFPVQFRYGPTNDQQPTEVRGSSVSGLLVHFDHDPNSPLGTDMPSIAERPRSAELRGKVVIDFLTPSDEGPTRARVSSEGPFKYEFPSLTATFKEQVIVHRPTTQNHFEEITCNLLALIFETSEPKDESTAPPILTVSGESPSAEAEPPLLDRMVLRHVRALARQNPRAATPDRVTIRSTANGIECELDDLQFDAKLQLLTLSDPERVNVWREVDGQLQKFDAPKIEIRLTNDRQLGQLSGIGAGEFIHRADAQSRESPELWARWKDRLDLIPDPANNQSDLTIRGAVTAGHWDQMQVTGETVAIRLADFGDLNTTSAPGSTRQQRQVAPRDDCPVKRLHAIGNVTFVAPGVVGRRIDQVELLVEPGQFVPWSSIRSDPATQVSAAEDSNSHQLSSDQPPLVFECSRITGHAIFDPATQTASIHDLHGFEGVRLFRVGPEETSVNLPFDSQTVRVSAEEFSALNEGGVRQALTLWGKYALDGHVDAPVVARFGDVSIEGPRLTIEREKNLVTVDIDRHRSLQSHDGQVVLRFPVKNDFTGHALLSPAMADIACLEKITFDGTRATFLNHVKASLLDSNIRAEQMTATLNRHIDFSNGRPQTDGMALKTVECQDKVFVEMYQYDPSKDLVEILKATLHQFEINQQTGIFQGQGRGKIEDWRRSDSRRLLMQSRGQAQSNRPATPNRDYPWEYVSLQFSGRLEGSLHDRWGKLNDDIQLMYAPVQNAYHTFDRDKLSSDDENAKNAVWVGSDQMTVGLSKPSGNSQSTTATIEALGNAQMEGHTFNAFAYSLQYEQAKEMFTLLGRGREKATLNVQPSVRVKPSKLTAQVMRIFPSKQEVSLDNAKSFTTTFGGE